MFTWAGKTYQGTHPPIVTPEIFARVQDTLSGKGHPRHHKHRFAFSGLLRCKTHGCAMTGQIPKKKYTYYHCSGSQGKCDNPYFREEEIADRLGQVLRDIYIPDDILSQLSNSLLNDKDREETLRKERVERLQQRLATLRRRIDRAYEEHLDGKIPEDFWQAKSAEWQSEEETVLASLRELKQADNPACVIDRVKILELAHQAYSLYVRQTLAEKAKLLKSCFRTAPSMLQVFILHIESPSI
jgi:hypothetical protein